MSSIWDSTLKDFRDRTASREPTPGGGSVAAVAAAEGFALVMMALELNARRKDANPEAAAILGRCRPVLEALSASADEDIVAFGAYMAALRLPNVTPEQQARREHSLAVAAADALEAPLRSAERCLEAMELALEGVRAVHSGVASDVGAGAALLHGALTATLYNVDINLAGITDAAEYEEAFDARRELQRRGNELAYIIQRETAAKIARQG